MTRILHSGRTVTGPVVAFDVRWEGEPAGRTVRWATTVTSPDCKETVDLVYETEDGRFAAQYVLAENTRGRRDVAEDADLGEQEIVVRFPAEAVGVAAEWPSWRAVIDVDGTVVAEQVVRT
jgi:hypothetical protein